MGSSDLYLLLNGYIKFVLSYDSRDLIKSSLSNLNTMDSSPKSEDLRSVYPT
jgi:hypothetical protein